MSECVAEMNSNVYKVLMTLLSAVHRAAGRCGACLSGSGPTFPPLLFHLPVLPAEQKSGRVERRLLLHSLVRHHRNARV